MATAAKPSCRERNVLAISERDRLRADFIRTTGWSDAGERLLAGDASFRKYFRLTRAAGTAVVMDAPAPQEDVRPFVRIGRHLLSMKLSAPEIHAVDETDGFLLLEWPERLGPLLPPHLSVILELDGDGRRAILDV